MSSILEKRGGRMAGMKSLLVMGVGGKTRLDNQKRCARGMYFLTDLRQA
jgi:hypothetical protein